METKASWIYTRNMVFRPRRWALAGLVTLAVLLLQWQVFTLTATRRQVPETCIFGVPCEYNDELDLRIIILVYNRPDSLRKCLESLQGLELDGDRASVEVWVDRGTKGKVNDTTVKTARTFFWKHGPVNVRIQPAHAGIYGQWIDSWRPRENSKEVAIFLEDDVDLSPYAYRWLKAAMKHYGSESHIAGYSLYEGAVVNMKKNPPDLVFKHRRFGTQGFAPSPKQWRLFQDWFQEVRLNPEYHPYVDNDQTVTGWYRAFEKVHTQSTMWSMWFIKFTDDNDLWTVYPNMAAHAKTNDLTTVDGKYLAYHRREKGLHFRGKASTPQLIGTWYAYFIDFPKETPHYAYNGSKVTLS